MSKLAVVLLSYGLCTFFLSTAVAKDKSSSMWLGLIGIAMQIIALVTNL